MHLQSSSKFLELLKSAGKRVFTPGTRVAPGEYPGWSPDVGSRGTWRTRRVPEFDRGLRTGANRSGDSGHRIYDGRLGSVGGFFFAERQVAGRGKAARRRFTGRLVGARRG